MPALIEEFAAEPPDIEEFPDPAGSGSAIDLTRPRINNPDGSFSTERTITIEADGKHFLIPTIVNGSQLTPPAAIEAWRSGRNPHVGVFNSAAAAEDYAVARSREIGNLRGIEEFPDDEQTPGPRIPPPTDFVPQPPGSVPPIINERSFVKRNPGPDVLTPANFGRRVLQTPVGKAGQDVVEQLTPPIAGATKAVGQMFGYAGNVARAVPADLAVSAWQRIKGQPIEGTEDAPSAIGNLPTALQQPLVGDNIVPPRRGQPPRPGPERRLPIDEAIQAASEEEKQRGQFPIATIAADVSQGLAEMAPKMALLPLAGESLLAQSIAAGGLFGLDNEGNFHPKDAAFNAMLPGVGTVARKATAVAIGKAIQSGATALENPAAQKLLEALGDQAGLNAFMIAQSSPDLMQLYHEDKQAFARQLSTIVAQNLALGLGFGAGKFRSDVPSETRKFIEANAELYSQKTLNRMASGDLAELLKRGPMQPVEPIQEFAAEPQPETAAGFSQQVPTAPEKIDLAGGAAKPPAPQRPADAVPLAVEKLAGVVDELRAALAANQIAPGARNPVHEAAQELTRATTDMKGGDPNAPIQETQTEAQRNVLLSGEATTGQRETKTMPPAVSETERPAGTLDVASPQQSRAEADGPSSLKTAKTLPETQSESPDLIRARAKLESIRASGKGKSDQAYRLMARIGELEKVAAPRSGSKRVARGVGGRRIFKSETEINGPDILSWMVDNGFTMMSKSQAKASKGKDWWRLNQSLYDEAAPLARPHHNTVYGGQSRPDQVAQAAYEAGVLKSPDVSTLWKTIHAASARRGNAFADFRRMEKFLQEESNQGEAWQKASAKGEQRISADELKVGDSFEVDGERVEVTHIDPATLEVTLKDGKKFGRQTLSTGESIHVEKFEEAAAPPPANEGSVAFEPPAELQNVQSGIADQAKSKLSKEALEMLGFSVKVKDAPPIDTPQELRSWLRLNFPNSQEAKWAGEALHSESGANTSRTSMTEFLLQYWIEHGYDLKNLPYTGVARAHAPTSGFSDPDFTAWLSGHGLELAKSWNGKWWIPMRIADVVKRDRKGIALYTPPKANTRLSAGAAGIKTQLESQRPEGRADKGAMTAVQSEEASALTSQTKPQPDSSAKSVNERMEAPPQKNKGTPPPPAVRELLAKGSNVGEVLRAIAADKSNPYSALVAKLVANADAKSLRSRMLLDVHLDRSFYDPSSDISKISGRGQARTETILEEALHALTVRKLPESAINATKTRLESILRDSTQPMAVRRLIQAYLRAKANVDPDVYHMKNLAEFIAGAFRDDGLKKELQAIKFPKTAETLWQRFVYSIRQLLGLDPKMGTLLDEVLSQSHELISAERPEPATAAGRKEKAFDPPEEPAAAEPEPSPKDYQSLKARKNEVDARLEKLHSEIRTANRRFTPNADALKSERWKLTKESLALQRQLSRNEDYVAELLLRMDQTATEMVKARKAGNSARARELGEHLDGMMQGELQQVPEELRNRVYNDLVARGKLMKSETPNLPNGRTLGELTGWLKSQKVDSPKIPIRDRLNLAQRAADEFSRGRDAVTKAADRLMAGWEAFKAQYKSPPTDTPFRSLVKDWLFEKQWTGLETHKWVEAIRTAVPQRIRRQALSVWLEANGDQNLLRLQADEVPPRFRKVWEAALTLTPKEQALARRVKTDFEIKLGDALNAGLVKRGREDYGVPQLWSVFPKNEGEYNPNKPQQARKLTAKLDPRDPFFSLERTNPTYFDGIMAGGVPKSLDVGDLVGVYNSQFHNALADRAVIKALKDAKAEDGTPLVMISGAARVIPGKAEAGVPVPRTFFVDSNWRPKEAVTKDGRPYQSIDHWALRDWTFAAKDTAGNPIIVNGDFLVHPDAAKFLKNELGRSILRDTEGPLGNFAKVTTGLLQSAAFQKASKFASATFHLSTLAEHSMFHAFAGKPTAQRLGLLWPSTRGVELDPARNPRLARLMRAGMELGFDGQRELFSEGLGSHGGIWAHVPGLGDAMTRVSDFMFKRYLPALKLKTGEVILKSNEERYGSKLSQEQIAELTARQVNAAFGGQQWRLMGTNKTLLDVNRLFLTAPDFLLSRAKVVGQALKPHNREQTLFLMAQAAIVYTAARVLNQLLDKDPHWEPNNAFRVIYNGRSYAARFIVQDIEHLIQEPVEFASGRLGPYPRSSIEAITGRDMRTGARKEVPWNVDNKALRSAQIFLKDSAEWMIPVGMEGLLPGASARQQTGPGQVALALVGVGSRKYTAQTKIWELARKFNLSSSDPATQEYQNRRDSEAHVESAYKQLDNLLTGGDLKAAQKEYDDLVKEGHTPKNIANRFSQTNRPFTGKRDREEDFKDSLSKTERMEYDRAIAEREKLLEQFLKLTL